MQRKVARVMVPSFGSGFVSNLMSCLSFCEEADRLGLNIYFDWRNTAFCDGYNPYIDSRVPPKSQNPWGWWFDQDESSNKIATDILDPALSQTINQGRCFMHRNDKEKLRRLFNKFMPIKKSIIDEAQELSFKYFNGSKVLGVIARGSEFHKFHPEYGFTPNDLWIKKVKKTMAKNKELKKIFLVTEDSSILEVFRKNFDNLIYLDVFRKTDETEEYTEKYPLWPCLSDKRTNHKEKLGRECLVQMLLLGRCEEILAKHCGTLSGSLLMAENMPKVQLIITNPLLNPHMNFQQKIKFFVTRNILRLY